MPTGVSSGDCCHVQSRVCVNRAQPLYGAAILRACYPRRRSGNDGFSRIAPAA